MKSSKDIPLDQICEYLGEDLDSELCKEIMDHLSTHPGCRAYLDSIKKTVNFIKTCYSEEEMPNEVMKRLKNKLEGSGSSGNESSDCSD